MGGGHNGGAETTLHDVMRLLRLDGHQTTALLSKPHPDGSGSYALDGVKVQAVSSKRDPELYFPANDLIISHLECAARSGLVSRKHRKQAIHLLHNDQAYCVEAAEKYANALIFNSDWIKSAYSKVDYLPSVVLHPPVDPGRYTVETSREYITIINLTVGTTNRLSYNKGALTFYELARRFPDEKFLAVKGGYGDQYIPDSLPPNVTVMEHSNNILEVYRKTKIILNPSTYESYGRVAVEAACSGVPSITTETLGTREAMGYGATFADPSDTEDWALQLESVLNTYDSCSLIARERAEFNWKRTQEEWTKLKQMIKNL